MKYIPFFLLVVMLGVGMGQVAFAQETPPVGFFGGGIPAGPQSGANLVAILDVIVDWVFVIVLIFSVIFIVLAGWQFITQGGNAQAVSEARMKLLWAAIGIAVAVMARGIPVVVRNIIGFP